MVAKIGVGICVLAAILLYGAGILFWLAIISALVVLIAGFAGAYIAAIAEMRKTEDTASQMEFVLGIPGRAVRPSRNPQKGTVPRYVN